MSTLEETNSLLDQLIGMFEMGQENCKGGFEKLTECSRDCGYGTHEKVYRVIQEKGPNGIDCPYTDGHTIKQMCILRDCNVDEKCRHNYECRSGNCDNGTCKRVSECDEDTLYHCYTRRECLGLNKKYENYDGRYEWDSRTNTCSFESKPRVETNIYGGGGDNGGGSNDGGEGVSGGGGGCKYTYTENCIGYDQDTCETYYSNDEDGTFWRCGWYKKEDNVASMDTDTCFSSIDKKWTNKDEGGRNGYSVPNNCNGDGIPKSGIKYKCDEGNCKPCDENGNSDNCKYSDENCGEGCATTKVDPCDSIDCGEHGTCNNEKCDCEEGYGGNKCDECDEGYILDFNQFPLVECTKIEDSCESHTTKDDCKSPCKWCANSPGSSTGKCVDADVIECPDLCGTTCNPTGPNGTCIGGSGACWNNSCEGGLATDGTNKRLSESEWQRYKNSYCFK
jgi:hypothetical protein